MTKEEILTAVRGTLSLKLFSEIVTQFNDAEDDFRENITLRDRVDWLEKQLRDINSILERKQPEYVPDEPRCALPTMDDVRNPAYRARRDRYFDSLRGRDKSVFSMKEEF